jgi:RNA polymerase sigma-70 factor (ECF subfamily)
MPSIDPRPEVLAPRVRRPCVEAMLRLRGVDPRMGADGPTAAFGEATEAVGNRNATALMALYRDTRSAAAFDALYGATRDGVLAWIQSLLRRGRSPLDPSELLQDTFVNVYRYPTAFRDEHDGSFRVWVRTIAANLVRRAGGRGSRLSFQELPEGMQEPEDRRGSPLRLAQTREESSTLRSAWVLFLAHYAAAWQELAPRDREALRLVEVEGKTYLEAGEVLAVGRSNMKMIVFRARRRLARRMRAAMGGGAAPRERHPGFAA